MPAPVDEGVRTFVEKLVGWTDEGKMLKDAWVSAAGSTYRAGADDFINAQIPFYYSGSWQVANLSTKIGDAFDWVATGSPCGTAACSGLQGGAALVAIKYTKNPEEVAKVIEYLGSEPVVKEFTERTLFLPAHEGVIAKGGLNFVSDDPHVQPALEKFVAASQLRRARRRRCCRPWKWANAYYAALVTRTSQVMAGELPLDEAFTRMDQDIADAVDPGRASRPVTGASRRDDTVSAPSSRRRRPRLARGPSDPPLRALASAPPGERGMIAFFLLPNMAIFGVFVLFPLVTNFVYSMTGGNALFLADRSFVGAQHYARLLDCQNHLDPNSCRDDKFWTAVWNTAPLRRAPGRADDRRRDGHRADPQPRDPRPRLLARASSSSRCCSRRSSSA